MIGSPNLRVRGPLLGGEEHLLRLDYVLLCLQVLVEDEILSFLGEACLRVLMICFHIGHQLIVNLLFIHASWPWSTCLTDESVLVF